MKEYKTNFKHEEIGFKNNPKDDQLSVFLFPKKSPCKDKRQRDIDIIKLLLKSREGEELPIFMTPDEALEISSLLVNAVNYYLYNFNNSYKKDFISKLESLNE